MYTYIHTHIYTHINIYTHTVRADIQIKTRIHGRIRNKLFKLKINIEKIQINTPINRFHKY